MAKRGRPRLENPRSFTVPEVRVTKEELTMFKLKAGFLGGSTAALIRKAVESYIPKLQQNICCDKEMEIIRDEEVFPFTYGDKECLIKVSNIPFWRCNKCGEMEEAFHLMLAIEEIVDERFKEFLKSGSVPQKIIIDFNELLQFKEPQAV